MQQQNKNFIPDGWKFIEFDKIANLSKEKYNPNSNEHLKCLELEHFDKETGFINGYIDSANQSSTKNVFKCGDILFGKLRPYLKKYTRAKFDGVCSTEIWVLFEKKFVSINDYIFLIIQTDRFNYISNVSSGTHMPRADWAYVSNFPFLLPPLSEQEAIAGVLGDWDNTLELLDKQIELKQEQKKYLMQALLTGTVRLHGFTTPWNKENFGNLFYVETGIKQMQVQSKDYNKTGSCPIIDQGQNKIVAYTNLEDKLYKNFPVIVFGDHTRIIKWIDFPFCIGADGTQLLKTSKLLNLKYGFFVLQNTEIENLGYSRHLKILKNMHFNIPTDINEQNAIADILTEADDEIVLLKQKRELVALQKKYLTQTLLTGQIRIPIKKDN